MFERGVGVLVPGAVSGRPSWWTCRSPPALSGVAVASAVEDVDVDIAGVWS